MSVPYNERKHRQGLNQLRKLRKRIKDAEERGEILVIANPNRNYPDYRDLQTEMLKAVKEMEREGKIPFKIDSKKRDKEIDEYYGYSRGGEVMCRGNGRAKRRPTKLR